MRHLLHGVGAAVVGLLLTAAPLDANATQFLQLTPEEAIDRADLIVRGTVTEVWTERDDRGRVLTRAQVEVAQSLKGDAGEAFVVDQIGGIWAGIPTLVAGAAEFSAGEEVVMYLDRANDGRLRLQRMGYGKWTVRVDPHTGAEIVQQFFAPPGHAYDHRFIPAPALSDRVFLSDFTDRIEQRIATTSLEVK
jgi:hypothetical protein